MRNQGDTAVMIACGLALLAVMTVAQAEALSDPTRPPPAIEAPPVAKGEPGAAAPAAGVQTIIQRQGARPAAVINGEYVELGGRIGEARVTRISENSVTLRSDGTQETLTLTPGIEWKAAKAPAKSKAAAEGRK